ncbi:MAG: OadG family protein [Planctomycetes bacterium]|nr:OadG family protein [Planctomycetota bacterium]
MNLDYLSLPAAFGTSILGFSIVFFVLIMLMAVIVILRNVLAQLDSSRAGAVAAAPAAAAAPAVPAIPANMVPATGSVGEIKLHDVDDTSAALIMAIVADELKAPLNELRFLSIREKK